MAASGCVHTVQSTFFGPPPSDGRIRCVAVLPFNNVTDSPEAGDVVPDLLAVELYASRRFMVLESAEVEHILTHNGFAADGPFDLEAAKKIGKLLGVEGIFFGSVSEYGFRNLSPSAPAVPVAGVRASFLDVKKGEVLWSGEAWDNGFDLSLTHRMPLNEVAQLVARRLLHPLLSEIPERDLDHGRACWTEPGVLLLARTPEPPPLQRPPVRLTPVQRNLYDAFMRTRNAVLEGVTFKPGGMTLSLSSIAALQAAGPALKAVLEGDPSLTLRLEGHCDAMETELKSQEISVRRAERVREFLIRNFSLPAGRVEAVGAGSGKPLMPNTTARGRAKNRRVEVHAITSQPPGGQ